ncbi:hypothetical protein [Kribbella speibonae]|uniref:Lipoprotein n=1 Tax=Kribbella speibonae TaxID=1572660 RepID=A0ABY2A7J4_9ACTN|nr:hypothetical protein [Kribbella speibonae]TCC23406.1 hypothetical protein E0H58_16600 [Kribbella speibonae]
MPRRPLLAAAATLSTLTLLTACNGSPEAGRPNTTPTTPSTTPTPTPTPTAPSTPTWTPEQQVAITAAKARYVAATAAADQALTRPTAFDRPALEKAGLSSERILELYDQAQSLADRALYQAGTVTIVSTAVKSVKLDGPQPEVVLTSCLDASKVILRFQKDGKPVPVLPGGSGRRHVFEARLVYAAAASGGQMWFLSSIQGGAKC